MKQKFLRWFLTRSKGISISTMFPKVPKKDRIVSSVVSWGRPPTKILPERALAFFGSTRLPLMTCSPAFITLKEREKIEVGLDWLFALQMCKHTLSRFSAVLKTRKANPLDLPVCGSIFTVMLSISPYFPKCSRSSSARKYCWLETRSLIFQIRDQTYYRLLPSWDLRQKVFCTREKRTQISKRHKSENVYEFKKESLGDAKNDGHIYLDIDQYIWFGKYKKELSCKVKWLKDIDFHVNTNKKG